MSTNRQEKKKMERIEECYDDFREKIYDEQRRAILEQDTAERDDMPPEEDERTTKEYAFEKAGFCSDGLSVYTPETQQFILDHFELLWVVEQRELELIQHYRKLDEVGKRKILHMLESVPVSLAMVQADGRDKPSERGIGNFYAGPRIVGSGSHRWLEVICEKNDIYHRFLQSKRMPPQGIFNDLDLENDTYFKIVKPEIAEKFDEQCIELANHTNLNCYIHLGDESVLSYYERICLFHQTYYDNLNSFLKFTTEEWYLLYLLTRMQIADFVGENMLETYAVADDYHVQEQETLLWTYLDMLEK